ncbi:fatty acyl-AMP ligase [Micromonospora sp. NPDC049102]|uniref:fatty acyl-AMP ligase n=1 Tax=Micromonospora sp. NPDC049102 TaxID=3364265 RepID=UPI00371D61AC
MHRSPSIGDLLRRNAIERGEQTAVRVAGQEDLSWAEVERRARLAAASLSKQVEPGDRVALAFPTDVNFLPALFGCWYAGAVAIPVPPGPAGNMAATHGRAKVTLTQTAVAEAVQGPKLLIDQALSAEVDEVVERSADDLALIQYTSGSVGLPKGVLVTHRAYLHNLRMLDEFYHSIAPQVRDVQMVCWLPHFHDMGLALMMYTVLAGGTMTLIPPIAFLKNPAEWLQTIGEVGGNLTAAPNFAFDLCVRRVSRDDVHELDLRSMAVVLNAAEQVRPDTVQRFNDHFAPAGFRPEAVAPCYGLAENTVFVSGVRYGGGQATTVRFDREKLQIGLAVEDAEAGLPKVGCGLRPEGLSVRIVDPDTREECPSGRLGEIWLHGPSTGSAYWGVPESSDVFAARIAGFDEQPYLRTGDRGFLWQGELYVCGRLADVINLEGLTLHPEDIEHTVERSLSELHGRRCAAVPLGPKQDQLAVVAETTLRLPLDAETQARVEGAIRSAVLAEHGVSLADIRLLPTGGIPVTTSGKVKRAKTRALLE